MKIIGNVLSKVQRLLGWVTFESSQKYWVDRYKKGGNSGHGSYGPLAMFKADFLNEFVNVHGIRTVIEYGCGDGNQLLLAKYPNYIGFDISPDAISLCKELFKNDPTKSFHCTGAYKGEKAQLTLSLDVIYHLVEDSVFEDYMRLLFSSSEGSVIIYSTNEQDHSLHGPHIKHRHFTEWVQVSIPDWEMVDHIANPFTSNSEAKETSKADFFVYRKLENAGEQE